MSEGRVFAVDSRGETEAHPLEKQGDLLIHRFRNIVSALGEGSLTSEQIGNADYFIEPGGRVIDTETGAIVDNGDGNTNRVRIPREAIQNYEENK